MFRIFLYNDDHVYWWYVIGIIRACHLVTMKRFMRLCVRLSVNTVLIFFSWEDFLFHSIESVFWRLNPTLARLIISSFLITSGSNTGSVPIRKRFSCLDQWKIWKNSKSKFALTAVGDYPSLSLDGYRCRHLYYFRWKFTHNTWQIQFFLKL